MALDMRAAVLGGELVEAYRAMAADSACDRTVPDKFSELQQLDILTVWNFAPSGERLDVLSEAVWHGAVPVLLPFRTSKARPESPISVTRGDMIPIGVMVEILVLGRTSQIWHINREKSRKISKKITRIEKIDLSRVNTIR